jgi:hypothetical protein
VATGSRGFSQPVSRQALSSAETTKETEEFMKTALDLRDCLNPAL